VHPLLNLIEPTYNLSDAAGPLTLLRVVLLVHGFFRLFVLDTWSFLTELGFRRLQQTFRWQSLCRFLGEIRLALFAALLVHFELP